MKTKYGAEISNEIMVEYFQSLLGRIYKLLPMHKDDKNYNKMPSAWETLDDYLYSLLCEIAGGNKLILEDKRFIELLNNLENLFAIKEEYKKYRSQVFKCTNLCKKIIDTLKKGVDDNGI